MSVLRPIRKSLYQRRSKPGGPSEAAGGQDPGSKTARAGNRAYGKEKEFGGRSPVLRQERWVRKADEAQGAQHVPLIF